MLSSATTVGRVSVQTLPPITLKNAELISEKNVNSLVHGMRLVQNSYRQLLNPGPAKADFLTALKERLAERGSGAGLTGENHTNQALKPWQMELARVKAEFANSEPERKAAEAKEDARVAAALHAEAVEKEKQKAAETEKAYRVSVDLKLGADGIPLPPPLVNFVQREKISQIKF